MCMGALIHARVAGVVFGADDPRWGAAGSLYDFAADHRLNHRVAVTGGLRESECPAIDAGLFPRKRKR